MIPLLPVELIDYLWVLFFKLKNKMPMNLRGFEMLLFIKRGNGCHGQPLFSKGPAAGASAITVGLGRSTSPLTAGEGGG